MKKNKIDIITLGCSKNLVDSERLMAQLVAAGYEVSHDSECPNGEIAVVNTCGFIADAQEESINMILDLGQRKASGELKQLYVMGCLSERFFSDLKKELPEVDKFYGKFNWTELLADLGKRFRYERQYDRQLTTPNHYAYLKISEGCNRSCSYCAIPIITGRHQSRPMEDIVEEVRYLVSNGVKEFQVIAQELTYYGLDIYKERRIAQLIEAISDIPGVEWIRLHYAYPKDFPIDLLRVMRERKNVCKYLDIALQHIADPVLNAMHRNFTKRKTYEFVEKLRQEVPGIHIRTTLMVGHPGESEEAFEELIQFVKWARFERMGAFTFSQEMGTYSAEHYKDEITQEIKDKRLSKLMRLQQCISSEIQEEKVGKCLRVIIDRKEGDYYIGRTEFDSPEVDPETLIPVVDGNLEIGQFYDCEIYAADDFDLFAHVKKSFCHE